MWWRVVDKEVERRLENEPGPDHAGPHRPLKEDRFFLSAIYDSVLSR